MRHTLLTLLACLAAAAPAAAAKPNVVVILVDDLGYADLSAHGSRDVATLYIDSLAANGVRCTHLTGTIPTQAGLGLVYACEGGGSIGVVDRNQPFDTTLPQWRAFYVAESGVTIEQVGILVVWR